MNPCSFAFDNCFIILSIGLPADISRRRELYLSITRRRRRRRRRKRRRKQ